jgi:transcription antitermination factor NusG
MIENKNWYAVYTRPRWEKKVADNLNKRGVENYCPLNKLVKQWSDRKKTVQEPLFTGYVFVNVTESELHQVRATDGVVNMVYWLRKPAVIPDREIDAIRFFLGEHNNVTLNRTPINPTDRVRVVAGPLMEHEGHVVAIKGKSVKLFLPSLGFMMCAEVEKLNVEVLTHQLLKEPELYPLSLVR